MVRAPLKMRCTRCSENGCAELSRYRMMALERLAERAQWLSGKLARAVLIPDSPQQLIPVGIMHIHGMHARLLTLVSLNGYNGRPWRWANRTR